MSERTNDARVAEHLLVLRAQTGSAEAYRALFERYNDRLLYYARRMLSNVAEAEDVVQETWLSVIRNLARLEEPGAFRTWLYRIARNGAVSRLRKAHREVPFDDDIEVVEEDEEENQGGEEVFENVDAEALHAALESLSPAHRDVLTLRFLEDLSYEDIADVVECGIGTVRSRIHYAKKSLRRRLSFE